MYTSESQIIAVWAVEEGPSSFTVFMPDGYAEWADMNDICGSYSYPVRFYGVSDNAILVELAHCVDTSPYDEDDYATVTHTWLRPGDTAPYAIGTVRTDGRA